MQNSPLVSIRRSRWRLVDARAFDDCSLLTAAPLDAAADGTRSFLTPFDDVMPVAVNPRPRRVGHARWRGACRALIADVTAPGSLHSVARSRIDLMPHQLEPALAIVRGLATRLLIADEVGLGKTIQAAIVADELLERGAADRVLIVTPAGLRDQWVRELTTRFHLSATVADAAALRRDAASLPIGVNPWSLRPIAITSVDYVKRPDVLPTVAACHWDLVIVDEAHAAAGDSDRRAAVQALAAQAAYVVLLTATPHNGDDGAFASLCSIGSVAQAANARDTDLPLLMFRRSRADVRAAARRRIHALPVRSTPVHAQMHALLDEFMTALCRERPDAWLAASVLHKRAWSSAWSLARSVERRIDVLTNGPDDDQSSSAQLALPWSDPDGERSDEDDVPAWPSVALSDRARELRLLQRLAAVSQAAAASEPKLHALHRLLRRAGEPAIVFTEYRDTLLHVQRSLASSTALIHGGLSRQERTAALSQFTNGRARILLATDAASEGLNLHERCRLVINLELPWNPMRLEQRIGRVDRIGQTRTVHAIHLIAAGTREMRVLARLRARVAHARTAVGVTDMIGGDDERTIAHLAVFDRAEDYAGGPPPAASRPRASADLPAAAHAEAARIAWARSLRSQRQHGVGPIESGRPLAARARARLRGRLCGRMLLVWRVSLEAAGRRSLASTLVGVTVALRDSVSARDLAAMAERLAEDEAVLGLLHRTLSTWRIDADRVASAYLAAAERRDRAIAASAAKIDPPAFQPGLFDRRIERARLAAAALRARSEGSRAARIARLARDAADTQLRCALVLVAHP